MQDVCVRAYANLRSLEDLERPKSWLMKIQYRMFVDGARRRGRSPLRATADDLDATCASAEPGLEEIAEGSLAERRILDALSRLDKEQRALLALHVEGYTLAELQVDHRPFDRRAESTSLSRARAPRQIARHRTRGPIAHGEQSMNCTDVAAILDDHALSRLSAADRCALDEHVTACEPCALAWSAQSALLALPVPPLPPDLLGVRCVP